MSSTNTYIDIIKDISNKNKYTSWYIKIIQNALIRSNDRKSAIEILNLVEAHHILPKSFNLGGNKDKNNIAFLSPREHYICHLLLIHMLDGEFKTKMYSALWCMVNGTNIKRNPNRNFKINSYVYTDLKINLSKTRSENMMGDKNPNKSPERKLILSERILGDKNPMFGKSHTKETKIKISLSISGENNPMYGKKHTDEALLKMRTPRTKLQTDTHKEKCRMKRLKKFYFTSPHNEQIVIDDLKSFCIENSLSYPSMLAVNRNKQKQHKSWIKTQEDKNLPEF